MPISTINQNGLNAPLTLTSPTLSGTTIATTVTSPAATALTLQSAGTTALTIDTSQNVGIGTSSPSQKLHVVGNSVFATTTNDVFQQFNSTGGNFYIGIDNSSGSAFGAGAYGRFFYSSGAYPMAFFTNATERMRITSGGALCVGTTSATGSVRFIVESDTTTLNPMTVSNTRSTASTDYSILFYRNGSIVGSVQTSLSATSFVTSSDYRLKENIAPMTGALAKVQQLKPCTYTWKLNGSAGQGFIAHELQAVVPECVSGEKDAVDADGNIKPQGVDTSFLVATLTAAIQELKAEFDAYKASHP